jgi:hypothetical protein
VFLNALPKRFGTVSIVLWTTLVNSFDDENKGHEIRPDVMSTNNALVYVAGDELRVLFEFL